VLEHVIRVMPIQTPESLRAARQIPRFWMTMTIRSEDLDLLDFSEPGREPSLGTSPDSNAVD
jgi:hypothetical protein